MARGSWKGLGLQRGPEFSFKPATNPPPSLQPPAPGSAGVPPPPLRGRTRSRLPRCGTPARPQRRTQGLGPVTHLRPRDTHPPLAARGRQQGAAEPRRGRAAGRSPHLTCAPGQRRPPPKKTQKPKPFALLCSALLCPPAPALTGQAATSAAAGRSAPSRRTPGFRDRRRRHRARPGQGSETPPPCQGPAGRARHSQPRHANGRWAPRRLRRRPPRRGAASARGRGAHPAAPPPPPPESRPRNAPRRAEAAGPGPPPQAAPFAGGGLPLRPPCPALPRVAWGVGVPSAPSCWVAPPGVPGEPRSWELCVPNPPNIPVFPIQFLTASPAGTWGGHQPFPPLLLSSQPQRFPRLDGVRPSPWLSTPRLCPGSAAQTFSLWPCGQHVLMSCSCSGSLQPQWMLHAVGPALCTSTFSCTQTCSCVLLKC